MILDVGELQGLVNCEFVEYIHEGCCEFCDCGNVVDVVVVHVDVVVGGARGVLMSL